MPSNKYNLYDNQCILNNASICNSLKIFQKGIDSLNKKWSDGFFAWHGTGDAGITGICCNGWDTSRRAG